MRPTVTADRASINALFDRRLAGSSSDTVPAEHSTAEKLSRSIRVGLLGAGYIADAHVKALCALPGVRVQAVCDISASRARALAQRFGVPQVLSSIEEMAASDCDVVHVLLPPALHLAAAATMVEA